MQSWSPWAGLCGSVFMCVVGLWVQKGQAEARLGCSERRGRLQRIEKFIPEAAVATTFLEASM